MERIQRIDHIGIRVRSIDASLGYYTDVLGLELIADEIRPDGTVRLAYLSAGESTVQLVEPLGDGPSADRLREAGEGLDHICFAVDDLSAALAEIPGEGDRVIDAGGRGSVVAFLTTHPNETLVELLE